jgi:hypothetical protein
MEDLSFHPLADLFPLMEGAEFDELVADIKKNRLREKIILYQGKVLDGRNRYRALRRLGKDPGYIREWACVNVRFIDKANSGPEAYVVSANIHRRHLTAERKRDLIAKLIKSQPKKSNRQIAKTAGVSHPYVAKVRSGLERSGDVETVTTSIDTKGRNQPAKKAKPRAPTHTAVEATCEHNNDLAEQLQAAKIKTAGLESEIEGLKAQAATPTTTGAPDPVAANDEIALLREFARFVIDHATGVTVVPKDHGAWKHLRARVKQALASTASSDMRRCAA